MEWTQIIILLIIAAYFFFTFYVYKRIGQARYINEDRRKTHRKLIWFLPFIGPLMIRGFWTKQKKRMGVQTRSKRSKGKGDFTENTGGIWGWDEFGNYDQYVCEVAKQLNFCLNHIRQIERAHRVENGLPIGGFYFAEINQVWCQSQPVRPIQRLRMI